MEEIKITENGPNILGYVNSAINNSRLVYNKKFIAEFREVGPRPRGFINIDVSTLCNLRCHMCPFYGDRKAGDVAKKIMDYGIMTKILDEVAEYCPGGNISLTCRGELFCHPRAMDILREIKKRNLNVCFVTNGTLFGKEEISEMIAIGVNDIRFSVDALYPETYANIRGADKLKTVVSNIWEFLHQMKGFGAIASPSISLIFVLQNLNGHEYYPFIHYWGNKVDEITGNKWTTHVESPLSMKSLNESSSFPSPERYLCMAPWRDLFIDSDGNVYPCCADSFITMNLGNVKENSLREIWEGERYMSLRREMLCGEFNEFKQCAKCQNWNIGARVDYESIMGRLFKRQEYLAYYKYQFLREYPARAFDFDEYVADVKKTVSDIDEFRVSKEG